MHLKVTKSLVNSSDKNEVKRCDERNERLQIVDDVQLQNPMVFNPTLREQRPVDS